jgi:hypothetical protein
MARLATKLGQGDLLIGGESPLVPDRRFEVSLRLLRSGSGPSMEDDESEKLQDAPAPDEVSAYAETLASEREHQDTV